MAADTFSALLGLLEQGTGNNNNSWGTNLNVGTLDKVDLAIAGRNAQSVTGGTLDLSGTPPPAGPSGALHAILDISGTLVSNQIIQVPNLSKMWIVRNGTTGSFTLTVKTPGGSPSTFIPQGGWAFVWCDGTNNIFTGLSTTLRDTQWLGADGTVALPGISFAAEPSTGIRRKGTNDIVVVVGAVDLVEITGAGAGTPNTVNFLSPLALQLAGVPIRPPGEEIDYSGLTEPAGWYFPAGQAKSRTTDAPLFAAIAPNTINGVLITGNTHTNTTLDSLTVDMRGLGLVGAFIEGTGIPTGTTIVSIAASSLVLSAAATGTASGITIRVLPYGQGDASTTFNLPDRRGTATFTRDDMAGTARGLLTKNTTQGIDGTKLNAIGGEQSHQLILAEIPSHTHANSLNDPSHTHTTPTGVSPSSGPVLQALASATTGTSTTSASVTGMTITNASAGGDGIHNNIPPGSISNRLIKR